MADLNSWLASLAEHKSALRKTLEAARDEIVALRVTLAGGDIDTSDPEPADTRHVRAFRNRLRQVRAEALEEAARECERCGPREWAELPAVIRALKDK